MNVGSVSGTGYAPLPTFQDMAAIMAARPSMAQLSTKAAVQVSAQAEDLTAATRSASANGSVDLYL
jgi:hypothetical protein